MPPRHSAVYPFTTVDNTLIAPVPAWTLLNIGKGRVDSESSWPLCQGPVPAQRELTGGEAKVPGMGGHVKTLYSVKWVSNG